jgi:hypothetical protein
MIGFTAMIHVVWRFQSVWDSVVPSATVRASTALIVLGGLCSKLLRFLSYEENSSPSSLEVHNRQTQCSVRALGSCTGCHCNRVLELHLILEPSSAARACESAEPQPC